ncbi:MAG: hypothetical protein AB7G54_11555 [Methyloceanibacter sp.]
MHRIRPVRAALLAAVSAATLALAGCGGVEFQGKIFDYMGVSGDRKQPDVRMAERPPLLLPPDPKALPEPQNGVAAATARQDWPQNPEVTQKQIVQQEKEKQSEEQRKGEPLHPYIGKKTLIDRWLAKDEPAPVSEVPEPDPTDKTPTDVAGAKPKPLQPHVSQDVTPKEDPFNPPPPEAYKNPSALY